MSTTPTAQSGVLVSTSLKARCVSLDFSPGNRRLAFPEEEGALEAGSMEEEGALEEDTWRRHRGELEARHQREPRSQREAQRHKEPQHQREPRQQRGPQYQREAQPQGGTWQRAGQFEAEGQRRGLPWTVQGQTFDRPARKSHSHTVTQSRYPMNVNFNQVFLSSFFSSRERSSCNQ